MQLLPRLLKFSWNLARLKKHLATMRWLLVWHGHNLNSSMLFRMLKLPRLKSGKDMNVTGGADGVEIDRWIVYAQCLFSPTHRFAQEYPEAAAKLRAGRGGM